jgi:hypothetical protein
VSGKAHPKELDETRVDRKTRWCKIFPLISPEFCHRELPLPARAPAADPPPSITRPPDLFPPLPRRSHPVTPTFLCRLRLPSQIPSCPEPPTPPSPGERLPCPCSRHHRSYLRLRLHRRRPVSFSRSRAPSSSASPLRLRDNDGTATHAGRRPLPLCRTGSQSRP